MIITANMGLTAWDLTTDPYDHSQLASNFTAIDQHNHTVGKGVQVPTDGIANLAITSAKLAGDSVVPTTHIPVDSIPQSRLADNSVGTNELLASSVTTAKIAAAAVTLDKLDPTILPIGFVAMWYRADPAVLPPSGWEVMDGRAWSTITNKLGAGGVQWNTGNIPNMQNKFPLGAATAGTGTGPSTPPDIGGSGGLHERDLQHTHTTNPHSHVVDSHSHTISADGSHHHGFSGLGLVGGSPELFVSDFLITRDVGVPRSEGTRQAIHLPGAGGGGMGQATIDMQNNGSHSHGGATATANPSTSSVAVTVNNALGVQDLRPAHVGLLFIMKVQ